MFYGRLAPTTGILSRSALRLKIGGARNSHRPFHCSRQLKTETAHALSRPPDDPEKEAELENWIELSLRYLPRDPTKIREFLDSKASKLGQPIRLKNTTPEASSYNKIRKIADAKLLKLDHPDGIFVGPERLSFLQTLLRAHQENPREKSVSGMTGVSNESISRLLEKAIHAKIIARSKIEDSEPRRTFHIQNLIINGEIKDTSRTIYERYTVTSRGSMEYYDVCVGLEPAPGHRLYRLRFEDVDAISWPAIVWSTKPVPQSSYHEIKVEMSNGDTIKFVARSEEEAKALARELKRWCQL